MEHPSNQFPIIRPTLPPLADIMNLIRPSWEVGTVTVGPMVRAIEEEACRRTLARHAIAFSSCTAGLMLIPQALNLRPGGEVIVPSFTFAATVQALVWNKLTPVFCDCLPGTCTLDPADVGRNLSAKTVAICPVYIYGLPPDVDTLLDIGGRNGIPVYFDSAQGLGSTYKGNPAGPFGLCEVFSLSPTKVVTAIEGGLITTNDDVLSKRLRCMRDYGKDPDSGEDMIHLGLSARLSEFNAAAGLLSLWNIDTLIKLRLALITLYREHLGILPGCWVQDFPEDRSTNGNYFVLFITERARRSRDQVYLALKAKGIQTKRYFFPPVHRQTMFQRFKIRVSTQMTNTDRISEEGLALPLYSHMTEGEIEMICRQVEELLR